MIFCIIFHSKICEKIIPKVEKNTTQVKKMWYNMQERKRTGIAGSGGGCDVCEFFSSICPVFRGKPALAEREKQLIVII